MIEKFDKIRIGYGGKIQCLVFAICLSIIIFGIIPAGRVEFKEENKADRGLLKISLFSKLGESKEKTEERNISKDIVVEVSERSSLRINKSILGIERGEEIRLNKSYGEINFEFSEPVMGDGIVETIGNGEVNFELNELDKIPNRLSKLDIEYPENARIAGIEGIVNLIVKIDKEGKVKVESVECENKIFESPAVRAVENLRYEVPTKNGIPVNARFRLSIPFKILK